MTVFTKKRLLIIPCIIAIVICFFVFSSSKCYAYSLDEWRPSVEINKELFSLNEQKANLESSYNQSSEYIYKFENNSTDFDENIENCQKELDKIQVFVDQKEPEIEQLTKSSYAAYFAKLLMDDVVGHTAITNFLFHWNVVKFMASSQDQEILNLLADYYSAQLDLSNAINEKNNAETNYANAQENIKNYQTQIPAIDDRINFLNLMLIEVLDLEALNGKPGESCIEGGGVFCNPCPGAVPVSFVGDVRDGYVHKGVDMAISTGTPIYCAADGVVIDVGVHESMGNFIKIMHDDGLETIYMHCSVTFVPKNVKVHKGDNIALVGNTGDSTGSHLHFQTEKNGEVVNGLDYM